MNPLILQGYVDKWRTSLRYLNEHRDLLSPEEVTAVGVLQDLWRSRSFGPVMTEEASEMIEVLVDSDRYHSNNRDVIIHSKNFRAIAKKFYTEDESTFLALRDALYPAGSSRPERPSRPGRPSRPSAAGRAPFPPPPPPEQEWPESDYMEQPPLGLTTPVTLRSALLSTYRNYAVFTGCATRAEYWYSILGLCLLSVALAIISEDLFTIFFLASIVPYIALAVRRMHDIGKSGWWLLINLIPSIGSIVFFILTLLPSRASRFRLNAY